MFQRLIGHDGAKVGAPYADVDDVLDRLARRPRPFAAADLRRKRSHLVEDLMHLGDDVLSVDVDDGVLGRTQGCMQHRAVLGDVDLLAGKHGLGAALQADLFGQGEEQLQRLVGDAIFRVIEQQTFSFKGVFGAAIGILRKEILQCGALHPGSMFSKIFPGLAVGEQWLGLALVLALGRCFCGGHNLCLSGSSVTPARVNQPEASRGEPVRCRVI